MGHTCESGIRGAATACVAPMIGWMTNSLLKLKVDQGDAVANGAAAAGPLP